MTGIPRTCAEAFIAMRRTVTASVLEHPLPDALDLPARSAILFPSLHAEIDRRVWDAQPMVTAALARRRHLLEAAVLALSIDYPTTDTAAVLARDLDRMGRHATDPYANAFTTIGRAIRVYLAFADADAGRTTTTTSEPQ